jgi:acetyl-CoA C-acetyltransferase
VPDFGSALICEPVRTPIGRAGGVFQSVPAAALGATVIASLVERAGLGPEDVDDVLFGQCYPNGEAPAIGRVAALDAGLSISTPGLQIDRRCGSGLQAILYAAMQVSAGVSELVIAGGAESMSQAEHYSTDVRYGVRGGQVVLHDRLVRARETAGGERFPVAGGMIETAENLRREYRISRGAQDELSVRSHQRAVAAQDDHRFDREIVPVRVRDAKGHESVVSVDEHPRRDTSLEALAALRPVMAKLDPEATVTAGNASGQNDAAAACIVTTPERAAHFGIRPLGRVVSWAVAGVPPHTMGIGPVPATAKALKLAGLGLEDVDLLELNEAFAAQVIACTREWKFTDSDMDRVNVNGSGISLGHPVGATGARIAATLLRELDRRGGRYAVETMCIGGGQGLSAVFARVSEG